MSDYTRLPREIKDCMERAGSPLSEDQFILLAGYLAPIQQKLEADKYRDLIDLAEMLAEWQEMSRKVEGSQARIQLYEEGLEQIQSTAASAPQTSNMRWIHTRCNSLLKIPNDLLGPAIRSLQHEKPGA